MYDTDLIPDPGPKLADPPSRNERDRFELLEQELKSELDQAKDEAEQMRREAQQRMGKLKELNDLHTRMNQKIDIALSEVGQLVAELRDEISELRDALKTANVRIDDLLRRGADGAARSQPLILK
jgi:hypothetical protein